MTMKSLTSRLVNQMTFTVTTILILVFLAIDISIDNWIDSEFESALSTKSNYLKSLIKVTEKGTQFDLSGEFIPEFSLPSKGEYFQLWQDNISLERSESLKPFTNINLIKTDLPINHSKLYDVDLPDGREGRAMTSIFQRKQPQHNAPDKIITMQLTVAISSEEVSNILIIIDSSLLIGLLLVIFIIRWAVLKVIHRGLQPLEDLNNALRKANISQTTIQLPTHSESFSEIEPIKNELNKFIKLNIQHLQNEKRITADIAHELKTPISELISLSEIYIRYPEDQRIGATYKQDVLNISSKMKNIVNNLLLLQQSNSKKINQTSININGLIEQTINELSFKYADISQRIVFSNRKDQIHCIADKFSLHTILTNLLDNALFYSPAKSTINLLLISDPVNSKKLIISIENTLLAPITANELENLTRPLYQIEKSRTNQERHGLGLAIVNNIARVNKFDFKADLHGDNMISFSISLLQVTY